MTFHLTCVHINLVRFGLLSGHLLGNSCSVCLFVILAISNFGFEGWIWVLIASVPDLCILHTFMVFYSPCFKTVLNIELVNVLLELCDVASRSFVCYAKR